MVALETTLSSFWIMANNSWMQVPVGYEIVDGRIIPSDWMAIVLGEVSVRWLRVLARLPDHRHVRRGHRDLVPAAPEYPRREARLMLHWGLALAALAILPQLFLGHLNGEYTERHQPSKFTAIEGRWQTEQPARLVLFAWPDAEAERNRYELAIPTSGGRLRR